MKLDIGTIFNTTEGYRVQIVDRIKSEKSSFDSIVCKFLDVKNQDGSDVVVSRLASQVSKRIVPNPVISRNKYNGTGLVNKYNSPDERKIRDKWYSLLARLHDDEHYNKNVTITEEWMEFSNFYNWVIDQTGWECYSLDKDIKQFRCRNKIYSPDTCIFVPQAINTMVNTKEMNSCLPTGISYRNDQRTRVEATVSITTKDKKSKTFRLGHFDYSEHGLLHGFIHSKLAREYKLQKWAYRLYDEELINKNAFDALINYRYYSHWVDDKSIDDIIDPNMYYVSRDNYIDKFPVLKLAINEMLTEIDDIPLECISKLIEYKRG